MSANWIQPRQIPRGRIVAGLVLAVLVSAGCSPQTPKVYHIGIISGSDGYAGSIDGFKARMAELGYAEGKNVIYDEHRLNNDRAGETRVARTFVADRVDLIYAINTEPALAAKAARGDLPIPILFSGGTIEGTGLVVSLREPGKDISGVRFAGRDVIVQRLELLLEIAPRVRRLWTVFDPDYPSIPAALDALRETAAARGITVVEVRAKTPEAVQADLQARAQLSDGDIDAMLMLPDVVTHVPATWEAIRRYAKEHRIPIAGSARYTVEQGALFGNADDAVKTGRLVAPMANKVLRGMPAGTLPVVTPDSDIWINYKVAQELGLTVPEGLLKQATGIIR